jgi:hypothetical protein
MGKLTRRTHRGGRHRAVMCRYEIHDAEGQRFDLGQGGDRVHVVQGAMRFDQYVQGKKVTSSLCGGLVDEVLRAQDVFQAVRLGQDHVGEPARGGADDDLDVLREVGASDIVQTRADAVEAVVVAIDERRDQLGVGALVAGAGTVLAVEGDVENGTKLLLQGHRLAHQLLAARIVVAGREQQRLALALE